MNVKHTAAALGASFTLLASSSHAAVTITGDVTAAGTFTLTLTTPITFTITGSGGALIVFDEWVTSDGTVNISPDSPGGQTVAVEVLSGGGTTPATEQVTNLVDNLAGIGGDISANDGYFTLNSPLPAGPGDTLTILPQSFTLTGLSNFNPGLSNSTFTGNAFLTDFNAVRVSPNASVDFIPEPTVVLLGLFAFPLLALRRRRK